MAYNKLRSKVNRAIAAYLVTQGAGGPDDVSPANSTGKKGFPFTTVQATLSKPEVQLTGLRRVSVHISIKGSAVQNPDEPNPDQSRKDFDDRVGATYDAMMQSDDGQTLRATADAITTAGRALAVDASNGVDPVQVLRAANNADMVDFTCQNVYDTGEGDGEADGEGCSWEEILMFDVIASPSNVD
jgi:hypothetical protein